MHAKQERQNQSVRKIKKRQTPQNNREAAQKMKYESPLLTRYGSVEALTKTGGSTQPDAHQGRQVHPGNH